MMSRSLIKTWDVRYLAFEFIYSRQLSVLIALAGEDLTFKLVETLINISPCLLYFIVNRMVFESRYSETPLNYSKNLQVGQHV